MARMADYARRGRAGTLVVMDANTRAAAGAAVSSALRTAEVPCRELVFEQREGLLPGPDEVATVRAELATARAELASDVLPVAVGSGVITDIVRHAAHLSQRDFISVPTAASMDGYASAVAAMQVDGVKVTFSARAPLAIFADPAVIARAPAELTRAGLGDLLAKATAGVDWLAAHLLLGEPYSESVAARVLEPLTFAVENAVRVMGRDSGAAESLLSGLVQSGVAMAMIGNSRPASGAEHHASHFWDLLAARGLRSHAPHGLQVGYATRFTMRMQRIAFGGGITQLRSPLSPSDPDDAGARRWLGDPMPAEIVAAMRHKRRALDASAGRWPRDAFHWAQIRERLAPCLARFDAVERALTEAGIPAESGYLDLDRQTLRATFRYASRLRARYTVIDLLEGQGELDRAINRVIP